MLMLKWCRRSIVHRKTISPRQKWPCSRRVSTPSASVTGNPAKAKSSPARKSPNAAPSPRPGSTPRLVLTILARTAPRRRPPAKITTSTSDSRPPSTTAAAARPTVVPSAVGDATKSPRAAHSPEATENRSHYPRCSPRSPRRPCKSAPSLHPRMSPFPAGSRRMRRLPMSFWTRSGVVPRRRWIGIGVRERGIDWLPRWSMRPRCVRWRMRRTCGIEWRCGSQFRMGIPVTPRIIRCIWRCMSSWWSWRGWYWTRSVSTSTRRGCSRSGSGLR